MFFMLSVPSPAERTSARNIAAIAERAERDQGDDDDQDEVATGQVHDSGIDPGHAYSS